MFKDLTNPDTSFIIIFFEIQQTYPDTSFYKIKDVTNPDTSFQKNIGVLL